jgi:predicted PurR-regulated permease PerM
MNIELSQRQQATVAAAITLLAVGFILAVAVVFLIYLAKFWIAFSGVFSPLLAAAILALIFKPYYAWLVARVKIPIVAILFVFLSVLLPIIGFSWFFGAKLVSELADLIDNIPGWLEKMWIAVQEKWPHLANFLTNGEFEATVKKALREQTRAIAEQLRAVLMPVIAVGAGFFRFIASALGWFVLPVYLGYFLMAEPVGQSRMESHLTFLKPDTRKDVIYLVKEFINILIAFFRGQFLIAFIDGVIFAVSFAVGGLKFGLALGLLLGLLNVVPYLGTFVGLAAILPLAFSQEGGGIGLVAWVLVTFMAVQTIESYVLTPRIMGDRTGLHPVAIIVAMFFWGSALGGIGGMILAIPLTAFLVVFWRLLKEKYLKAVV